VKKIQEFMDAFDADNVEINIDDSSGIGVVTSAIIHNQRIFDRDVSVVAIINDESDW
jgi:hypothetical protein